MRNRRSSVMIDPETDDNLDYLMTKLCSPKAWIVKRLVEQEMAHVKRNKRVEVVA